MDDRFGDYATHPPGMMAAVIVVGKKTEGSVSAHIKSAMACLLLTIVHVRANDAKTAREGAEELGGPASPPFQV